MTPAMIIIVFLSAVLLWFLAAGIFKFVGGRTKKLFDRAITEMTDEDIKEAKKDECKR